MEKIKKKSNEKQCPRCGTENPDDAVFCGQCGYCLHKLSRKNPIVSVIRIIVIIVVLAIIGVAGLLLYKSKYAGASDDSSNLKTSELPITDSFQSPFSPDVEIGGVLTENETENETGNETETGTEIETGIEYEYESGIVGESGIDSEYEYEKFTKGEPDTVVDFRKAHSLKK